MSNATEPCEGHAANSIHKPSSPIARGLPLLLACVPKLGCPLCWPALAALCSLCGLPFATLNPLLIGVTLLAIALLLFTAVSRHTFGWSSRLLLTGLLANLGARFWAVPVWVGYIAAALVLTVFVAEFLLPGHFAMITPSPHCIGNCRTAFVSSRSQEKA